MELEDPKTEFRPIVDERPRMPEPLPVRLIAIEDVRFVAPPGIEDKLDAFYVNFLQFQRIPGELSYRADNFILRFQIEENRPMPHESMRPQGIEILSLADAERMLIELEHEYTRQKGTSLGHETLLLLDPAGNWVELSERRMMS